MGRKGHARDLWPAALAALAGVGDAGLGEWREWTGYAAHVRRRCSAGELALVGPVADCRGTAEWSVRFEAARAVLPPVALRMAWEERRP